MMETQDIDNILVEQGVRFLPWIGNRYQDGFNGRRLLVLGESHYDEWEGDKHVLASDFTRSCVLEAINRVNGAQFWKYIEQVLLNEYRIDGWAPGGGSQLWEALAFYNFVQSPISGGPRSRPGWKQFDESRRPFRAVLEALRPERVLVCGKGLWEGMETVTIKEDYLHDDLQAYRLEDGTKVWCFATVHPSSGRYSWTRLYPLIKNFIEEPEKFATEI